MRPRISTLVLSLPLACTGAGADGSADARALQAATAELATARAAWDEERAATTKELAELRKAVAETNARLDALAAEPRPPVPVPGPVMPMPLPPEAEELPMSIDVGDDLPFDDPLAAVVKCESASHCKLDKAWLELQLADPAAFAKQARLVPKTEDGKPLGVKLYGIRRGSLPKALGLKNGDMVKSINGNAMGTIDEMLEAYTKLRRKTTLILELERKGVSLTLTIEVVDHL